MGGNSVTRTDIDDITLLQFSLVGYSMTYNFVHGTGEKIGKKNQVNMKTYRCQKRTCKQTWESYGNSKAKGRHFAR
jgi:hypothetical protein